MVDLRRGLTDWRFTRALADGKQCFDARSLSTPSRFDCRRIAPCRMLAAVVDPERK